MTIAGSFEERQVWIDGKLLDPAPSLNVIRHSPDGFAWGYAGSGPSQLSLAILLYAGVDEERAVRLHQLLKRDLIQGLPQGDFLIQAFDLEAWMQATGA